MKGGERVALYDSYKLEPSPLITINGREEGTANFQISAAPVLEEGNLAGIVQLQDGSPVANATVKLFNSTNEPFEHTSSNAAGRFNFVRLPVGSYFITAAQPSLLTPLRLPITIVRNRNTNVTITMQQDPSANRNAVYGTVRNPVSNELLNDANVILYRVNGETNEEVGTVTTNTQGQYLFADLSSGTYMVAVSKIGFFSDQSTPFFLETQDYVASDINLNENPETNNGTISGIVTDGQTNQPLSNAYVALYAVVDNIETLIRLTKTNLGGLYLFGNITPGTYRIKAKVQIDV